MAYQAEMNDRGSRGRGAGRAAAILLVLVLGACGATGGKYPTAQAPATPSAETSDRALALAERAISDGRVGDAKVLLDRLAVAGFTSDRFKIAQAELQLSLDAPQQAYALFESAIDSPDYGAIGQQGRGLALLRLGRVEGATVGFKAAVKAQPDLWRAWNGLAVCHDRAGDFAEAEKAYERALAIKPNSAFVLNNRGFSRLLQGRADEAVEDLAKALHLNPSLKPAQENLRLALAWKGDYAAAISGVHGREMSSVLNNVGYIAMLRGDLASAESYLLRAMESSASYDAAASRNLSYLKTLGRSVEKP